MAEMVVQLRQPAPERKPLTPEEALDWLRAQPDGRVMATDTELAREWGWLPQRVGRRIRGWSRSKLARRHHRWLVALPPRTDAPIPPVDAAGPAPDALRPRPDASRVQNPTPTGGKRGVKEGGKNSEQAPVGTQKYHFRLVRAAVLLVGLAFAAFGVWINARHAWDMGRTDEARWTLGGLGLTTDLATVAMPALIQALWVRRRIGGIVLALGLYAAVMTGTLLNTAGYISKHIGDTVAGRHAIITTAAAATDQRSAGIEAAKLAVAAATAARAGECANGRGEKCRAREAEERQALAALVTAVNAPIAPPAAIATADPQVDEVRKVIAFVSVGSWEPSVATIEVLRLVVMLVPIIGGGILIGLAVGLGDHSARPRAPSRTSIWSRLAWARNSASETSCSSQRNLGAPS